ncbi:mutS like protein [Cavenderia fasciculata]|uniref:DNA mismatch repair protein n=1 Tax=Cavenderia fasciculata TaxID=261658 RepID=F4PSX6_CACFS|nr:mutS like protein [Cavenderia fasciculata]EGG20765.1 mutS like protein [Cavenderia fasciculata]|eukprot:XP_004358615.1 mutS like protein [Cavenderia fasciculata]
MSKRQTSSSNLKQSSLTSFFTPTTSTTSTTTTTNNKKKDEMDEDKAPVVVAKKSSSPRTKKQSPNVNIEEEEEEEEEEVKPKRKSSSKATKKQDTPATTTTSTSGRRIVSTNVNIGSMLDSDSEDEVFLKKRKKRPDSDDDYNPDGKDDEDESLSEDDGFIVHQEEDSDVDIGNKQDDDDDIMTSFDTTSTTTTTTTTTNVIKIQPPITMSFGEGQRIIISERVSLPAGTPTFTRDEAAKKKLLKGLDTMEKIRLDARAAAQKELEGAPEGDDEGGDEEEEEKTKKKPAAAGKGKSSTSKAAAKVKYTPLEQQYVDIKKQYPDTVLMVECGYKYKFFGNDAEVANKVLNIYSYVVKNFLNASIPTVRLYHHLRRLVQAGYKVGVVEQIETAALKAVSDSKGGPFERKLTRLYTTSTFIDDQVDESNNTLDFSNISPNYLVAFYEDTQIKKIDSPTTRISFVAISVSTGEIIYDSFDDDLLRSHLETRLTHLKPTEILLPPEYKQKQDDGTDHFIYSKFTRLTSKTIKQYCKTNNVRVQLMKESLYDKDLSVSNITDLYDQFENNQETQTALSAALTLDSSQIVCLSVLTTYLKDFNQFNSILKVASNFKAFKISNHLILPRSTIDNLEILQNEDTKSEKGSLYWVMNRTQTIAGKRLFLNWICKPLIDLELIKLRQESVKELLNCIVERVKSIELIGSFLKSSIPDLQRNLSKVFYKSQCKPKDFLSTMKSFQRLSTLLSDVSRLGEFKSKVLKELFGINDEWAGERVEKFRVKVDTTLKAISHDEATSNCKENIWTDETRYPKLVETKAHIKEIQDKLDQYLKKVRKEVGKPTLEYLHQPRLHLEYLIELPVAFKQVPKDWLKINATQKLSRYHTPYIIENVKLLAQHRERLTLLANEAWLDFLGKVGNDYTLYSSMITKLALLDCLMSLAKLGMSAGYVLPELSSEPGINVVEGRHPIVEMTLGQKGGSYVPNSIKLSSAEERAMIITGPNMGGKSSFIRQTSLIVIMAQMGSYVPAESCTMGVFDAIYTRMGARDNIEHGSSTFFVELQETSQILAEATPRTLVILDELGRGTSTHDGVAIAYSSLLYIVEQLKCFCLFVTHYPLLSQIENMYPQNVSNYHMSFLEEQQNNPDNGQYQQQPKVIFLYKVVRGAAKNSYGINVATLANLPQPVIQSATLKSNELKQSITKKIFNNDSNNQFKQIIQQIKELSVNDSKIDQNQRFEKLLSLQKTIN